MFALKYNKKDYVIFSRIAQQVRGNGYTIKISVFLPFQKGMGVQESKQEVTKVVSLLNKTWYFEKNWHVSQIISGSLTVMNYTL